MDHLSNTVEFWWACQRANVHLFIQDYNVYLKGMFNHRSGFFMSLILYLRNWKNASISNASTKNYYHVHYFKRFSKKKKKITQIIDNS